MNQTFKKIIPASSIHMMPHAVLIKKKRKLYAWVWVAREKRDEKTFLHPRWALKLDGEAQYVCRRKDKTLEFVVECRNILLYAEEDEKKSIKNDWVEWGFGISRLTLTFLYSHANKTITKKIDMNGKYVAVLRKNLSPFLRVESGEKRTTRTTTTIFFRRKTWMV